MINRLPTNRGEKLFYLWARLHTDATINELIPLNRTELCESVVFLHRWSNMTMLMNDSQIADELQKKIISFVGRAGHRRNHKWSNCFESRRIVRKCSFLTRKVFWLCTWMINRLPTNCHQKLFHLWARLHKDATINEVIPLNRAKLCIFLKQAKYSDYAHEWFTVCRRIADKHYFICRRGCTQKQP